MGVRRPRIAKLMQCRRSGRRAAQRRILSALASADEVLLEKQRHRSNFRLAGRQQLPWRAAARPVRELSAVAAQDSMTRRRSRARPPARELALERDRALARKPQAVGARPHVRSTAVSHRPRSHPRATTVPPPWSPSHRRAAPRRVGDLNGRCVGGFACASTGLPSRARRGAAPSARTKSRGRCRTASVQRKRVRRIPSVYAEPPWIPYLDLSLFRGPKRDLLHAPVGEFADEQLVLVAAVDRVHQAELLRQLAGAAELAETLPFRSTL